MRSRKGLHVGTCKLRVKVACQTIHCQTAKPLGLALFEGPVFGGSPASCSHEDSSGSLHLPHIAPGIRTKKGSAPFLGMAYCF